jgi:hypothetical protein
MYYPGIFLERFRKTTKTSIRIAGFYFKSKGQGKCCDKKKNIVNVKFRIERIYK